MLAGVGSSVGLKLVNRVAQHLVLRKIAGDGLLHLPDVARAEGIVHQDNTFQIEFQQFVTSKMAPPTRNIYYFYQYTSPFGRGRVKSIINFYKSQRWESNPQPPHYECGALPIEATLASRFPATGYAFFSFSLFHPFTVVYGCYTLRVTYNLSLTPAGWARRSVRTPPAATHIRNRRRHY